MVNLDATKVYGAATLDSGPVNVATGGGTWTLIGKILLGGVRKGALLQFTATIAALTHLKLTRAAVANGTHVDWIVDTAFGTATTELLSATSGLSTLSGATGIVKLDKLEGVQEIGVYAQSGGSAVLEVSGTAFGGV